MDKKATSVNKLKQKNKTCIETTKYTFILIYFYIFLHINTYSLLIILLDRDISSDAIYFWPKKKKGYCNEQKNVFAAWGQHLPLMVKN